ncbi:MAG: hypothetical protein ACK5RL_21435 [Acidimicrobiales bacterium]
MTVPGRSPLWIRHALVAGLVAVDLLLLTLILFKHSIGPFAGPS